jgi:hypothetical protein
MSFTTKSSRQFALVAKFDILETDFDALATAYPLITLPPNAIVTGGYLSVTTEFDGNADLDISISGGGCSIAAHDPVAAEVVTALTLTGDVNASGDTVDVTLAGTAIGTAGVAVLFVEYIVVDRESEVQDD